MIRQTVYRYEERKSDVGTFQMGINVNDELGIEPHLDYTLAEHLAILASIDLTVTSVEADVATFCDGSTQILQQREEEVAVESLNSRNSIPEESY